MPRPKFRIACCLCRKPIPQAQNVYALDEEWQRRFPKMVGTLSCSTCAVSNNVWSCRTSRGTHVAGHRPATRKDSCHDSWDHIDGWGTHVAMVLSRPWSGLQQGAEEYLRHTVRRPGVDRDVAQELQDVLGRWDERATSTSQPS
ncbi:hypothetical protein ACWDKQ_34460 [Saccharopolyspora sp. NPDC000995]